MNKALSILVLLGLIAVASAISHRVAHIFIQQTTINPLTGLPTTWGVSEAETNFKNITNLNAPNWIIGNQTIDDYNKDLFNFITNNNVTKCPLKTPFLRGSDSVCVNCTEPTPVFDLYKKDCVACPAGTKLNPETHKCEKAEAPQPTSKCTANYIWNDSQNKCICPDKFPIDLGCECVKCLEPFVWNVADRACKLRCEETHNWNNSTQQCECPKSAPYEVNGECIACNGPFEWQAATNTCQLKVNNCAAPAAPTVPTTPTTPTTHTCPSNYIWDNVVQNCVCPLDLPFNEGTKCVQCTLPQYWDHTVKQCLNCPQNQYFNTISQNCEPCPASKPLWRNYMCEACPEGTTYDSASNSCQAEDMGFDPSATPKVPVYSTTPNTVAPAEDMGFDPSATPKVPVYSTSPAY